MLYAPALHIHDLGAWALGEPSGTVSGGLDVEYLSSMSRNAGTGHKNTYLSEEHVLYNIEA